ncbi:hypothetical protein ACFW0U_19485 [Streptomyces albidoflavus]
MPAMPAMPLFGFWTDWWNGGKGGTYGHRELRGALPPWSTPCAPPGPARAEVSGWRAR